MTKIEFDNSGFSKIKGALSDSLKTRVGILGDKANEAHGEGMTNVEIGSIHEFGSVSRGIPPRSFLRVPLEMKIWEWIKKNKDRYKEMLEAGTLRKWYVALGFAAEKIVDDAFTSRGFGKWLPLKPRTIKAKGSDMPLIDTGQLRASISSQVLDDN